MTPPPLEAMPLVEFVRWTARGCGRSVQQQLRLFRTPNNGCRCTWCQASPLEQATVAALLRERGASDE